MSDYTPERRAGVLTLSSEEVRLVVRDENRGLAEGIRGLVSATEKMTGAVNDLIAESRVNDEKFANINAQLTHNGKEAEEANASLLHLSTTVIPEIERRVALNGFSVSTFWKATAAIGTPISLIIGYMYTKMEARDEQITSLVAVLTELLKGA